MLSYVDLACGRGGAHDWWRVAGHWMQECPVVASNGGRPVCVVHLGSQGWVGVEVEGNCRRVFSRHPRTTCATNVTSPGTILQVATVSLF